MKVRVRVLARPFLAGAFVLAAVSGLGAQLPGPRKLEVNYTEFTLPNGLNVILHEDHTVPSVCVDVWYYVGSAREKPGRTGFAHLFEHIMFEGSKHVKEGEFDRLLEAAGGDNNGSTAEDRTDYWETVPSSSLELALFVESDRMGYLLDVMSPARVDQQRDVVKNERRQSFENRPYGQATLKLSEALFPPNHPYHWPVIGSMEDLTAAGYEDVVQFFKSYYGPGNASLVVAGDIDPKEARRLVEKWFSEIPPGRRADPIAAPPAVLAEEKRLTLEDRVELPRLYMAWITPPHLHPGDAALDVLAGVLASGKNSRLYKRLVYELQVAQDVSAAQQSEQLASTFLITVTAREGHNLSEIESLVEEEINRVRNEPPAAREIERAVNQFEASFYHAMERVGGFGGKADQLNAYAFSAGRPDFYNEDRARYLALDARDVQSAARRYLPDDARVVLSVVPAGKTELAARAPAAKGK
ncbi:MAG TPA: pitrilysin family protein [Thermoanaerobaculia bacterium]|nr:pitrilysin family protein [Thermoanaerobaculia bacterium]